MTNKNPFLVGLITLFLIIAIISLILWKNSIFSRVKSYELIGQFETIAGLLNNSLVKYRGHPIGRVTKIDPTQDIINVHFFIESKYRIPEGSKIKIMFEGLVGEEFLEIIPNRKSKSFYTPGSKISGYSSAGLADFIDVGTQNLIELKTVLETMSSVFGDKNIANALKDIVIGFKDISKNMDSLILSLNTLTNSERVNNIFIKLELLLVKLNEAIDNNEIERIKSILLNLEEFSSNINNILSDEDFKKNITSTFKGTGSTFQYSSNFLNTVAKIKLLTSADFNLYTENKNNLIYTLNFNFWLNESYLNIGVSNYLNNDKLINIQLSSLLTKNIRFNYGIIKSKPGIGLNYYFISYPVDTSLILYDFGNLSLDFNINYTITNYLKLISGFNNLNKDKRELFLGVSLSPGE